MRARAPNVSHCITPPLPPGAAAAQPAAAASACMRTEAVRPATPAREPAPARKSPSHALTERRVWFLQQRQRSSSPTMPVPRKILPCIHVARGRVHNEASVARSEQATLHTTAPQARSAPVAECYGAVRSAQCVVVTCIYRARLCATRRAMKRANGGVAGQHASSTCQG